MPPFPVPAIADHHLDVINALRGQLLDSDPMSALELATAVGLRGNATSRKRDLRYLVADLRQNGYPVLSGNDGYWLSSDPAEIRTHATALIEHGRHEIDAGRALMAAAAQREDQGTYGVGIDQQIGEELVAQAVGKGPAVFRDPSEAVLADILRQATGGE